MTLCAISATVQRGPARVLDAIDLVLSPGRVTAIVGPNGAGKSTLLAALAGTARLSAGQVRLDDQPLEALPARMLARRRAVLPQDFRVAFGFTVEEVVGLGRAPHAAHPERDIVQGAMARAGITHLSRRNVLTLSGGERQRVGLAKALAQVWHPTTPSGACWLLLDEPLAALDPAHQLAVLDAVGAFAAQGGGTVLVLHDLELARAVADTIIVMRDARIVAVVDPAGLDDALVRKAFGVSGDWRATVRRQLA
jgi:iron complex transport system ATP-binding protein